MTERRSMADLTDDRLGEALRDLAAYIAVPALDHPGAVDPARRARLRIEAAGRVPAPWWTRLPQVPRLGRGLVLAIVAALAIAVAAGAIGLGLPGIRIVPAPSGSPGASTAAQGSAPSTSPSIAPPALPTPSGPLGSGLGLGTQIALTDVASAADFPIVLPTAPGVDRPVTAWLLYGRLTLIWAESPTLPTTRSPGVGLLLSEFRGSVDDRYFQKLVGQGTTVETVQLGGEAAYWISGAPHEIIFVDPNGEPQFDGRRSVGDTLLWARDGITYRIESALGRDATIALAESLR